MMPIARRLLVLLGVGVLPAWLAGQAPSPEERARLDQLAREDHADMLKQLGITKLRPGANGRAAAGEPGAPNYDPAQANPYPDWPAVLNLKDGRPVTTAELWWHERRAEIVEDFEREVYGRVPRDVPKVTWTVAETVDTTVGGQPVVARRVIGHVDNRAHPTVAVDVKMAVVLPVNAKGPVPVLMMFGWGNMPDEPLPRFPGFQEPAAPPSTDQLIAAGWGYVSLSTASIQADNGAGLASGIIGLTNKGQRRTPEQWGSLRAWAWGAARALDYLETLPAVDARRVGIEGVSRYGKAALVTMAFEPRFALVLVGSSGEGGTKPHRRNFGEQVENLTGSGAYHWMAGNFLKYGAAEASFGSKNASDIPVDAHELIALCAPRPTFISYGVPEKGDANWLDQQGSFMATVAAGPVFRLLGARDLGVTEEYRVAKMPPVNTGLLEGELAWRQHDGGHEDRSNTSFFIAWANRLLHHTPPPVPPDQPRMRADRNSHLAHQQLLAKAKSGGIDVYFLGDSITRRWGALDYPDFLAHWNKTFNGWNAGNFGWGGDRTENILWRLENGELDGVLPKVIVILAGTNNIGKELGDASTAQDVTRGLSAVLAACRKKAPAATIVLTAVFPRNDNPAAMPIIARINANLAKMADGKSVRFLDVNPRLADAKGTLFAGMMVDGLHPSLKGYEVWANGLKPVLTALLGPPAATDHAPPPTGDPSAVILAPAGMARVGAVDTRYQSYNVEMVEVTGGRFWKPYAATSTVPREGAAATAPPRSGTPAGLNPDLFEYRPPIELGNARLRTLAAALGPAYVRVSGTWANSTWFPDSEDAPGTPPAGFNAVLTRPQWKGVLEFARAVDGEIVTSLATSPGTRDASGVWTPDQARRLLDYTKSLGGRIAAAELMNEPNLAVIGGAPAGYDAAAYGRDFKVFRAFVKQAAPDLLILGPGSVGERATGGLGGRSIPMLSTRDLLVAAGPGVDGFSYHHYGTVSRRCAGASVPTTSPEEALSEGWLSTTDATLAFYRSLRDELEPGKPMWLTETADAACGGNPWAPSFLDAFRYLDQLGRLARQGVQVVAHNTLVASDYGLLEERDLTPRPKYWGALLWRRLMGTTVLDPGLPLRAGLHVYAHCLRGRPGGIALLLLNTDKAAAQTLTLSTAAERYTLSSAEHLSRRVDLNGTELKLGADDALPRVAGAPIPAGPLTLAPATITFVAVPAAENGSCR